MNTKRLIEVLQEYHKKEEVPTKGQWDRLRTQYFPYVLKKFDGYHTSERRKGWICNWINNRRTQPEVPSELRWGAIRTELYFIIDALKEEA